MVMLSNMFCYKCHSTPSPVLQPRVKPCDLHGLGSCAFARHYLRNHYYFLFLRVLRCFSSPRSPHLFNECGDGIAPAGFPHSDICGSQGICPSPQLFAACRVLRRLREPQASPVRPYLLSLFSFAFLNLIHRCFFSLSLMSRCGTIMFCTTQKSRGHGIDDARFSLRFLSSVNLLYLCFKVANLIRVPIMSMISQCLFLVVPGRLELPTSTLSV